MPDLILEENIRRLQIANAPYRPATGTGLDGERMEIEDGPGLPPLYPPASLASDRTVGFIARHGGIDATARYLLGRCPHLDMRRARQQVWDEFGRAWCKAEFPFWAATTAHIKNKLGGDDVKFILNRPQRRLVATLERMRLAGDPIRLILLKARQWGGSTCVQLYMAWLQLMHGKGLNSLIIAHQGVGSDEIRDMYTRMISKYPLVFLHDPGQKMDLRAKRTVNVGRSGAITRVPLRNCKIKIGTAERPDSCRGGDYSLVHLSEVGIWKATDGKRPEDIVRSACSGVLYRAGTMIVMESTANGVGNYFHREYLAAREGESQFEAMFVPWHEIDQYSLPFATEAERRDFARTLLAGREDSRESGRCRSGAYLWKLWEAGATLEAINWYATESRKYSDHASMAAEYPSDDIEAFAHSGRPVFSAENVEALRSGCLNPAFTGEAVCPASDGNPDLPNVEFKPDRAGQLQVWELPEPYSDTYVSDRYLTVVDIGGRSAKADWTVVTVFDRSMMAEGGKPAVAAQWRGHGDLDIIAIKAAEIAALYDYSLLVIESNTVETRSASESLFEGYQTPYVMARLRDLYPNLYARSRNPEEIREGKPVRYGFHTNVSTKPMVIATLVRAVRERLYVERDSAALDEMLQYEQRANGSYGAIAGCHDDILMTRAIGLHVCFHEMDIPRIVNRRRDAPPRGATTATEASF